MNQTGVNGNGLENYTVCTVNITFIENVSCLKFEASKERMILNIYNICRIISNYGRGLGRVEKFRLDSVWLILYEKSRGFSRFSYAGPLLTFAARRLTATLRVCGWIILFCQASKAYVCRVVCCLRGSTSLNGWFMQGLIVICFMHAVQFDGFEFETGTGKPALPGELSNDQTVARSCL